MFLNHYPPFKEQGETIGHWVYDPKVAPSQFWVFQRYLPNPFRERRIRVEFMEAVSPNTRASQYILRALRSGSDAGKLWLLMDKTRGIVSSSCTPSHVLEALMAMPPFM